MQGFWIRWNLFQIFDERATMKTMRWIAVGVLFGAMMAAQTSAQEPAKAAQGAYYFDPTTIDLSLLIADPPAGASPANDAELAELHRIEETRTPAQVAAAKADDVEESIFVYRTVFGAGFNPTALPLTAELGAHLMGEQGAVAGLLKKTFHRPRPYQTDKTLHPVCSTTPGANSYPSGHSLDGYIAALTLVEIVPERRAEILARADDYAHNRMVCGVHYPSDLEASRRVSYAVFGYLLATPKFQHDLTAARVEMRAKLGLK
jgi:acid phosphatase (class A)